MTEHSAVYISTLNLINHHFASWIRFLRRISQFSNVLTHYHTDLVHYEVKCWLIHEQKKDISTKSNFDERSLRHVNCVSFLAFCHI